MDIEAHYDPQADIAWLSLPGRVDGATVSEETETGLRDIDSRTGQVVGVELWNASERLPPEFLHLLPPPGLTARA